MTFLHAVCAVMFWEAAFLVGSIAFVVAFVASIIAARYAFKTFNKMMEY